MVSGLQELRQHQDTITVSIRIKISQSIKPHEGVLYYKIWRQIES